jgi:hypothetical protein
MKVNIIHIQDKDSYSGEIRRFELFLKKIWQNSKPFAKLFKTTSDVYLYDIGTNKILECEDSVFELLNRIFSIEINEAVSDFVIKNKKKEFSFVANTIIHSIEKENVLAVIDAVPFGLSENYYNFEEALRFPKSKEEMKKKHLSFRWMRLWSC